MRNDIRERWVKTCVLGVCCLWVMICATGVRAAVESADNKTVTEPAAVSGQNPIVSNPSLLEASTTSSSKQSKLSSKDMIQQALLREDYAYDPNSLTDPFLPFIAPQDEMNIPKTAKPLEEDSSTEAPPEPARPLTPLELMSVAEIETGLKAIMWGEMGRRAVIQDPTGKGYIVSIGTPIAGSNGVITEIFKDRIVIQQEVWDKKAKKMIVKNVSVKLNKEKPGVN